MMTPNITHTVRKYIDGALSFENEYISITRFSCLGIHQCDTNKVSRAPQGVKEDVFQTRCNLFALY